MQPWFNSSLEPMKKVPLILRISLRVSVSTPLKVYASSLPVKAKPCY